MKGGVWRVVMLGLAVATAALVFLGVEIAQVAADDRTALVRGLTACGVGLLAGWFVFARLARHFRDLGRLSDRLAARASGERGRVDLDPWSSGRGGEVARLAEAASGLTRPDGAFPGLGGDRWDKGAAAALALADDPMLVLGEQGRVERLNPAAARLLGLEEGGDVGKVLLRDDLARAIERARGGGAPATAVLRRTGDEGELSARVADLGLGGGVMLSFPARGMAHAAGLSGKRTLSLRPAGAAAQTALGDEEPLAALPFVALWVATAGPEPGQGPVIAVGTVRLAGTRIFRTVSLSLLIDPVDPVPAEAAARHGIGTAMVAGERPFAEVWPAVRDALHHCVAVGVGVGGALSALAAAAAAAGIADPDLPAGLDLGLLAVALEPGLAGASFDGMAEAFGVPRQPRSGPQAEAMAQAELAAALVARLNARGIVTQGQARALMAGTPLSETPLSETPGGEGGTA